MGLTIFANLSSSDAASTYARLNSTLTAYVNGALLPDDLATASPKIFRATISVDNQTVSIGGPTVVTTPPVQRVSAFRARICSCR